MNSLMEPAQSVCPCFGGRSPVVIHDLALKMILLIFLWDCDVIDIHKNMNYSLQLTDTTVCTTQFIHKRPWLYIEIYNSSNLPL